MKAMVPAALALLFACAGVQKPAERLASNQRDVFEALQYGDYPLVSRFLRPDMRTDFLARAFGLEKTLHVVEFTPVGLDSTEKHARSVTRVSWYELPSTSVKTDTVFVEWARAEKDSWYIESILGGPIEVQPPKTAATPPPRQDTPPSR